MVDVANEAIENLDFLYPFSLAVLYRLMDKAFSIKVIILLRSAQTGRHIALPKQASVYKGYKRDKIEMRGDRAETSDFPLYLNTVAGGLDCRNQTIGGFSFVVKINTVPVIKIIG